MTGVLLAGLVPAAAGQITSTPIQSTEQSASIHGIIVNAGTDRPLARALVQVEGHSVLTGYDGRFEFTRLSSTTTTVQVTKPGFYGSQEPFQTALKSVPVGSPDDVEIKLYPEALVTGTMMGADGDPLEQVHVQALRRMDDEMGPRWMVAGQTNTNSDGEFRLPLPGGEYVVETQYLPERPGARGVPGAILPMMVAAGPNGGGRNPHSGQASTLHLMSGSEQHFDLHPQVRPSHAVHVRIDSAAGAAEGQFAPQMQAHLANGLSFTPASHRAEAHGEVVVNLPTGSYLLSASAAAGEDGQSYGETRVTVADGDVTGATIHLQKALELPIEASIDPEAMVTNSASSAGPGSDASSTTSPTVGGPANTSFLQQLGIFLQKTDSEMKAGSERVSPVSRRGGLGVTLLPGTYRLRAAGYSSWFIESATAGGTDLLTQDLVVDGGSSPVPIRLVVNNQTAMIKGTVKHGERVGTCFVYLIASAPSTSPVISTRTGQDGSFLRSQAPPGSYRVLASQSRLTLDLTDPVVQRQLAPYLKTVTAGPGETVSIDLDAMPAAELKP